MNPTFLSRLAVSRMRSSAGDTLSQLCVWRVLPRTALPLAPPLPSIASATASAALFGDFRGVELGEVELSPCLRPLAQTARAVFPQAAFLCGRHCGVEDELIPRPPVPIDASRVSSMPAQGLSLCELIRTSVMYSPVPRHSALSHSGAFPLRTAFWVRPASPFHDDDPRPFALISFTSTAPRSNSWHRIGRNFARAYIRAYRRMASGWALLSPLLALSSASVALFQPYPLRRTIPGLLSHRRIFPTVSPAHTLVRRSGTQMPSPP